MNKLQIFLVLILGFTSCSNESSTSNIEDDYMAILNCSRPIAFAEIFDNVKVITANENSILIDLKPEYGKISGTINDLNEVTINPYMQTLDDGSLVDMIGGSGSFFLENITGTAILVKTVDIRLDHSEAKRACQLLLNEKI